MRATNWLGDAVMSLPAMEEIRRAFPEAEITLLARPWVAGLYDASLIDRVIPYELPPGRRGLRWKGLAGKWELARRLRAKQFDCAILLTNSFESAALVAAAGIPTRIGYARDGRGLLLTEAIRPPRPGEIPAHQRYYYLELLRRAGLIGAVPEVAAIRLPGLERLRAEGRQEMLRRLAEEGWGPEGRTSAGLGDAARIAMVGVSPGAAFGTAKRWLPERFAEAAATVAAEISTKQKGADVLVGVAVFGSPDEKALCEQVCAEVRQRGGRAINFAGRASLEQYIALSAACVGFLTNDSGAMHVASALGLPTVSVFGATDHVATGPTGPFARILREPVECSPCHLRECPIDHRCMKAVEAARVAGTLTELIQIAGAKP